MNIHETNVTTSFASLCILPLRRHTRADPTLYPPRNPQPLCVSPNRSVVSGESWLLLDFFSPSREKRTKRRVRARGGLRYGRVWGCPSPILLLSAFVGIGSLRVCLLEPQATRPPWPLWHDICIKLENCIQPILSSDLPDMAHYHRFKKEREK